MTVRKTIGDTTYIVENVFSANGVTAGEKLRRLILNETREAPCAEKRRDGKTAKPSYGLAS
ncbi:MAG: hypothetical protein IK140_04930 [Clostridia bacterium]|nr:hypothetical protein [Clostridia bacterium]MBR5752091.1 hypothetical protein [Clostridia bacterium]